MKKVTARVVGIVVAAALIAAVVLFGWHQPKELRLAVVSGPGDAHYLAELREGMLRGAIDGEVEAIFRVPPEANVHAQLQIVRELAEQGYDGIAISPFEADPVREAIDEVAAKGIAVVTFGTDVPDSERLAHVGTHNRAAGRTAAKQMVALLSAAGRQEESGRPLVQILADRDGGRGVVERIDGFKEALVGTKLDLFDVLPTSDSPQACFEAIERAIELRPNTRGIFCPTTGAARAAARAVRRAVDRGTLARGRIRVVAFGASEAVLEQLRAGLIDCTLAQHPRLIGRMAVQKLVEFVTDYRRAGKYTKPPKGKDVIDTGVSVVRRDDLAK